MRSFRRTTLLATAVTVAFTGLGLIIATAFPAAATQPGPSGAPGAPGAPAQAWPGAGLIGAAPPVSGPVSSPVSVPSSSPSSAPSSGPPPTGYYLYKVVQEGLVQSQGAAIGQTFAIPNALANDGSFAFADATKFQQVPQTVGGTGTDKQGRSVTSQSLNISALQAIVPVPAAQAVASANRLLSLAALGPDFKATPSVTNDLLTLATTSGSQTQKYPLDTVVSYQLTLDGLPVTGTGSRLRVTLAPDGTVSQLSDSQRTLSRGAVVPVITVGQATAECAALYGSGVSQSAPTLDYEFPPLTATQANGQGTVQTIYPQYTCNPVGPQGPEAGRLVPAVAGSGPTATLTATRDGDAVNASVSGVGGGTAPYTYQWSSSTAVLTAGQNGGTSVSYTRAARAGIAGEEVSVQITDVNGLAATVGVSLPGSGSASAPAVPGGGGLERFATVGIEQTVNQWQCAQDSANGFSAVMAAHANAVSFDWRGFNAWEDDFHDTALGGHDEDWVDNVDDTWYTGHGWPGGFTFRGNNNALQITPPSISWGDKRVDWVELESCQVLRDTTGTNDYFGRWGPTMDGLHILNGFHTNAFCVAGGTGGTFAAYLFPLRFLWWALRPAFPVQKAWALMAVDREPAGVVYRSMGPMNAAFVNDIGDYFWGQGPVGPDIFQANTAWYWSITGTV